MSAAGRQRSLPPHWPECIAVFVCQTHLATAIAMECLVLFPKAEARRILAMPCMQSVAMAAVFASAPPPGNCEALVLHFHQKGLTLGMCMQSHQLPGGALPLLLICMWQAARGIGDDTLAWLRPGPGRHAGECACVCLLLVCISSTSLRACCSADRPEVDQLLSSVEMQWAWSMRKQLLGRHGVRIL